MFLVKKKIKTISWINHFPNSEIHDSRLVTLIASDIGLESILNVAVNVVKIVAVNLEILGINKFSQLYLLQILSSTCGRFFTVQI